MQQVRVSHHYLMELIGVMISVIEGKDPFLKGHSERVAQYCSSFSKRLSFPKKDMEKIYLAGLLHDLGMIYIPTEIIQKPGPLNDEEMAVVKQHPIMGKRSFPRSKY